MAKTKRSNNRLENNFSIIQIDNLLRFLNRIILPRDIYLLGYFDNKKEALKIAESIIRYRNSNSPFFRLSDLYEIPKIDGNIIEGMLLSARFKLVDNYSTSFARTFKLNLFSGRIFFDLRWKEFPDEWEGLGSLLILYDFKTGLLEKKEKEAKDKKERAQRALDLAEKNNSQPAIDAARERLDKAQGELDEINRESDEINRALDEKDLKKLWNIIKRNVEKHIADLNRKLNNETDPDKRKDLEEEIADYTDNLERTQRAVDRQ